MPQHLHNGDAAVFMGHARMGLHSMHMDGGKNIGRLRSLNLVWQQAEEQGGSNVVVPGVPSRLLSLNALAAYQRIGELASGATIHPGERISLIKTHVHESKRLRIGFTLARTHGETTLLITEHVGRAPRTPNAQVPHFASEIYYSDGKARDLPEAALSLFKIMVVGPLLPSLEYSPFSRGTVPADMRKGPI